MWWSIFNSCDARSLKKVPFPNAEPPEVELDNRFKGELFYEIKIHESKTIHTDQNYYTKIRKHSTNAIKRFSHCLNKAEITLYVENFVLWYQIDVITVIDVGILFFFQKRW